MKNISSLSTIIDRYDSLLLDLWGVIHDGSYLYPGVKETLQHLSATGKKIIFISNAPRRAAKAEQVLNALGVEKGWYDHIITSGEMGFNWLQSGKAHWGHRYYYIGPSKDIDVLEGLEYQRIDDMERCDFMLNVGFGSEEQSTEDFGQLLGAGFKRHLPMLCLNPDMEVVKISGERYPCAGVLAVAYEKLGGKVTYFGKPYPDIYDACMGWLGADKSRVLAIGDGVGTDVAGAYRYGIDSVLVTGGILHMGSETAETVCARYNVKPTYTIPAFSW